MDETIKDIWHLLLVIIGVDLIIFCISDFLDMRNTLAQRIFMTILVGVINILILLLLWIDWRNQKLDETIKDIRLMLIQVSHDFERLAHDIDILSGCLYNLKEKQDVEHFSRSTSPEREIDPKD